MVAYYRTDYKAVSNLNKFFTFLMSALGPIKTKSQGISSPPCSRSVEYLLLPVTTQDIFPPLLKKENKALKPFLASDPLEALFYCHCISIKSVF